ncbi:MAG: class I SAM-dependent methyltransferase [Elusimicrobiota bacterium]|nr:class I SAM-dependent methyltransferase [Elusimicrobiota bacterium]
MNNETRTFFDRNAAKWDSYEKPEIVPVIDALLDRIGLSPSDTILDVGCGTGILVPHFEKRGVRNFQAIDLSPEMAREYHNKFPGREVVAADYEEKGLYPPASFTKIIIFNAFPHFDRRELVFKNSYNYPKPGGGLYIVHSMSRADLDRHHREAGEEVAEHMLYSNTGFRELYTAAGFRNIEVDDGARFFSCGFKVAIKHSKGGGSFSR